MPGGFASFELTNAIRLKPMKGQKKLLKAGKEAGQHDKFADVGLVTEMESKPRASTYLGTEGYIAPEGPGTPAADVFSLGKVLYEACMGKDRLQFPDLPTAVFESGDPVLLKLNEIILKACELNPTARYQSAAELHRDLSAFAAK